MRRRLVARFPRIPAVIQLNNGDVLASYDGRPTGEDFPGPNSIVQRRSTDGGLTWGPETFVHEGTIDNPTVDDDKKLGYSDPSYVYEEETGTLFNFHVFSKDAGFVVGAYGNDDADRNVVSAEVSVSTDDGETWEHRLITDSFKTDDMRAAFAFCATVPEASVDVAAAVPATVEVTVRNDDDRDLPAGNAKAVIAEGWTSSTAEVPALAPGEEATEGATVPGEDGTHGRRTCLADQSDPASDAPLALNKVTNCSFEDRDFVSSTREWEFFGANDTSHLATETLEGGGRSEGR